MNITSGPETFLEAAFADLRIWYSGMLMGSLGILTIEPFGLYRLAVEDLFSVEGK